MSSILAEQNTRGKGVGNVVGYVGGIVFVVFTLSLAVHAAQNKLFWEDEGYEITTVLQTPIQDILLTGLPGQASANPLYYALQKLNLNWITEFNQEILVRSRLVSILAACLVVGVLYFFILKKTYWYWAIFTVLALVNYNIFFEFAVESRPYSLWLLCFTMLVLSTVSLIQRPYPEVSRQEKIIFFGSCLAVSLVVSLGIIQILFAVLACLFAWYFCYPGSLRWKPITHFVLPVMAVFSVIALDFALRNRLMNSIRRFAV